MCRGLSENGLIVRSCSAGTCFCCAPADVPFSDVALVHQTFCQCLCYRYTFGEGIWWYFSFTETNETGVVPRRLLGKSCILLRCTERTRCVMLFRLYACARRCQSLRCRFTFFQNVVSTVRMLPALTLVDTFCWVPSPASLFFDPSHKLSMTGHT